MAFMCTHNHSDMNRRHFWGRIFSGGRYAASSVNKTNCSGQCPTSLTALRTVSWLVKPCGGQWGLTLSSSAVRYCHRMSRAADNTRICVSVFQTHRSLCSCNPPCRVVIASQVGGGDRPLFNDLFVWQLLPLGDTKVRRAPDARLWSLWQNCTVTQNSGPTTFLQGTKEQVVKES